MPLKRISDINIAHRGLVTAIYGNYEDFYVDSDLKKYNLWQQLYLYMKSEGFDIVLFYDNNNNFHSYCKSDLVKFLNLNSEILKRESESQRKSYIAAKINSPLRNRRVSQGNQTSVPPDNSDNSNHYMYDSTLHGDAGFFKLRGLAHVFEHLSRVLTNNTKKTALIITHPGKSNFPNPENYLTLFGIIKRDYERRSLKNKILIAYESINADALNLHFHDFEDKLFSSQYFKNIFISSIENPAKVFKETTFFVEKPDRHELRNILNEFRLRTGLPAIFVEFDLITEGLFKRKYTTQEISNRLSRASLKGLTIDDLILAGIMDPPNIVLDETLLTNNLNKVIGQSEITPFIVRKLKAHFNLPERQSPISFFFVGTSGVGKTYTSELMAESLEKSGFQHVVLEMSEFQTEETANKLIGSPTGYVGSETPPRLFAELEKSNRLVIVFDEIEKAHERVITTLMQLLDKGRLSWNERTGDFRDCIIVFTSNAEQRQFVAFKNEFLASYKGALKNAFDDARYKNRMKDILTQAGGGGQFRIEVSGRINNYLVYNPLGTADIVKIAYHTIVSFALKNFKLKINSIHFEILGQIAFEFADSPYGLRDLKDKIKSIISALLENFNSRNIFYEITFENNSRIETLVNAPKNSELSTEELEELFKNANDFVKRLTKGSKQVDVKKIRDYLDAVIGQGDSQEPIISALEGWFRKMRKPINFFMVGPSGVGKTETAKLLALALSDKGYEMHRIDCNELIDQSGMTRVIGSAPGYIGSEQEPELFRKQKLNSRLIILFDEIEKAHSTIFTILMGLIDEGRLSWNGDSRDFSKCILIFTSNLAQEQFSVLKKKLHESGSSTTDIEFQKSVKNLLEKELRKRNLGSEIVGRIQDVLVYNPLSNPDIRAIAWQVTKKIAHQNKTIIIEFDETILNILSTEFSFLPTGARPLVEYLERSLGREFAKFDDRDDDNEILRICMANTGKNGKLKIGISISTSDCDSEYVPQFLLQPIDESVVSVSDSVVSVISSPVDLNISIHSAKHSNDHTTSIGLIKAGDSRGTGFLISADGYVVTAHHVIDGVSSCIFYSWVTKSEYTAAVLWADQTVDIALLKIKSDRTDFDSLNIYNGEENPIPMEDVMLMGYPMGGVLGEAPYVSPSTISNFEAGLQLSETCKFDSIATYTNATEGYSGGPLIRKRDNKVIGVLHGGLPDKGNINFASDIRQMLSTQGLQINIIENIPVSDIRPDALVAIQTNLEVKKELIENNTANSTTSKDSSKGLSVDEILSNAIKQLLFDYCIIDTNIWMETLKTRLYHGRIMTIKNLYQNEGKKLVAHGATYEELTKFAKSESKSLKTTSAQSALSMLKRFHKEKMVIIPGLKSVHDKDAYADKDIYEFAREEYRLGKSILFITNDNDCNIRVTSALEGLRHQNNALPKFDVLDMDQVSKFTDIVYNKLFKKIDAKMLNNEK